MTALKKDVITDTLAEVRVVYLNREISRWWNARKAPEDVVTFCGWYWIRGSQESGPFRTRSAALRDAYYAHVLHENLPRVWSKNVPHALIKGPTKKSTKKQVVKKRAPVSTETRTVP